jgi:hypothetical protein
MAQLIGTAPNQVPTNGDLGSMAYQEANNYLSIAQSGMRNAIINGSLDVWQRGTSWADGNNDTYTADRWHTQRYAANSYSISRQGTGGQAAGMPNFDYCQRLQRVSGSTSTNSYFMNQPIERINCMHLIGQTVTLSYYVRLGSTYTGDFTSSICYHDNSNYPNDGMYYNNFRNSGGTANSNKIVPFSTVWQRVEHTWSIPSTAIQVGVAFFTNGTMSSTAGANDYFEVTGVQLEVGTRATAFERRQYAAELALCQRYFQTTYPSGYALGSTTSSISYSMETIAQATTSYLPVGWNMPVAMRTTPTATLFNPSTGSSSASNNIWLTSGSSLPSAQANVSQNAVLFYVNNSSVSATSAIMAHFAVTAEL